MKANALTNRRRRAAATAALLCALVASLAFAVGPAAAEPSDSAPIRPLSDGGFSFPDITGPESPEEYPFQLNPPASEIVVRQVNDKQVVGEYKEGGYIAWSIDADLAHAADGATVPTTVSLSEDAEGPVITLTVHYRAGNPAAGGTPFVFPITGGAGWEGGYRTISVELNDPSSPSTDQPTPAPPVPTCTVPSLHGLGLRAAKARLRGADCAIGQVHLARGATEGKGKVVKQFRAAGTQLAAGATVAVKLGSRQPYGPSSS
jgi:hypothetical protein